MRALAIDLDGTILVDQFVNLETFGEVNDEVVENMHKAKEKGWWIIIHSCRTTPEVYEQIGERRAVELIQTFLERNNIPFNEIWTGKGKPIARFYVDDRAISPQAFSSMEW